MEKIVSVLTSIANFGSSLIDLIQQITGFLLSALGFIRYAGKTLIFGVGKLITYIFEGNVFGSVQYAFIQLSDYIGTPATMFINALLFIVIVRIIIAFVFKILKRNVDYEMRKTNWAKGREQTWEKSVSESLDEYENGRHIFHG